jgi:hypothetical protein
MTTSYLNNVKFEIGTRFVFTELGLSEIRRLQKENPIIGLGLFEVVDVRDCLAEDEHTELLDETLGCTAIKHVESGEVIRIESSDPDFWAFFTEHTPENFIIRKE